jgi:hypothetical protein
MESLGPYTHAFALLLLGGAALSPWVVLTATWQARKVTPLSWVGFGISALLCVFEVCMMLDWFSGAR